jgi:hypothetical protein
MTFSDAFILIAVIFCVYWIFFSMFWVIGAIIAAVIFIIWILNAARVKAQG